MTTFSAPYKLYYWPIPFRGHFVRFTLAYLDLDWEEAEVEEVAHLRSAPISQQPWPLMAPPVLHDREADFFVNQLQAIVAYLGEKHDLTPDDPQFRATTNKILGDCGDVLEEITQNCGDTMWSVETWRHFKDDRFPRWMNLFEDMGTRHGLSETKGYMLGTDEPSIADLAATALWHTMFTQLPLVEARVKQQAPCMHGLVHRIAARPEIAEVIERSKATMNDVYCGGEIERSLRLMLETEGL
ncbi:glutathione S-transferase family protein [Pseudovibrio exalbescens]|uniref:glutathione S-transferase family protein n=1 Tax=Pseudovibrio exalbescens TaxID=197461 RepID=UPI002367260C|nr:glutathione S-transferase family protein [Pseudovibrio exalbescens]MDD7909588.1 glutathione S-transferase family protein [Pseudovibrio exalbescens]